MHIDEIKSLIKRSPFRAFTLAVGNGIQIKISSPDHIAVNPFTDTLHLFAPGQVIYVASDAVVVMTDGDMATH